MATEHYLAVDKVHDTDAVILDDHGRAFTVPLDQLPKGLTERAVLRVMVDDAGDPDWSSASLDTPETNRRKRLSAELTDKLREADEHGFLHPEEDG
jgi:hypothetical protein